MQHHVWSGITCMLQLYNLGIVWNLRGLFRKFPSSSTFYHGGQIISFLFTKNIRLLGPGQQDRPSLPLPGT